MTVKKTKVLTAISNKQKLSKLIVKKTTVLTAISYTLATAATGSYTLAKAAAWSYTLAKAAAGSYTLAKATLFNYLKHICKHSKTAHQNKSHLTSTRNLPPP